MNTRIEVHFSGSVQGVGFRFHVLRQSRSFEVTGCVSNLPNGDVRLIAEGKRGELDRFLFAVLETAPGRVMDWRRTDASATHEFTRFEIEQ